MSARIAIQQMERFILSPTPEVMAVTGRWGVGKTYAWQQAIDAHRGEEAFLQTRYSYVSAFGMQTVEELKSAILQSVDTLDDPDPGRRWLTFSEQIFDDGITAQNMKRAAINARRLGAKAAGNARTVISAIPIVQKLAEFGEKLSFQAIRNQIICIDDIERAAAPLGVATILGVASELKEQRKCKILLLLNKEGLGEEEETFDKYLEKVSDRAIRFEPTPEEAAQLALTDGVMDTLLKTRVIKLGITNIRVIKRIKTLLELIEPQLSSLHQAVAEQAVASFAIIGWGVFEPTLGPAMEELKDFNGLSESLKQIISKDYKSPVKDINSPEAVRTKEIANRYGFINFDAFDYLILKGIQAGWFNEDDLRPILTKLDLDARVGGLRQAIHAPWEIIHGSFDDNVQDVVEALSRTAMTYAEHMSPIQITERAQVLNDLGYGSLADDVVNKYMDTIRTFTVQKLLSLRSIDAEPARVHSTIKAFIDQKIANQASAENPEEVFLKMGKRRGWSVNDIEFLSNLPTETYVQVLRKLKGEDIKTVVYTVLNLEKILGAEPSYKTISNKMRQALNEIASDSRLNNYRVRKFNVLPEANE